MAIASRRINQSVNMSDGSTQSCSFEITCSDIELDAFLTLLPGNIKVYVEDATRTKVQGAAEASVNKVSKFTMYNKTNGLSRTIKAYKGAINFLSTKGATDIRNTFFNKPFVKVGGVEYNAEGISVSDAQDS